MLGAWWDAVSTAAYPLLLSSIMAVLVEATGIPVDYPDAGYYVVSLAPALALLVGAALAFPAHGRSRN